MQRRPVREWLCGSLLLISVAFCCWLAASRAEAAERASLHRSLVQVLTTANPPDQFVPWQRTGPTSWSGSGVVIPGPRILTAAHVVADQVMVEVRRAGQAQRYTAQVAHVCHPCDLALLTVADPAFFEGAEVLEIGALPHLQQPVEIHGFPEGGSGLAITSGIVSRIDVDYYVHSFTRLLLVQVDAAINPGNSGGPAISNGKVVGIAMQMDEGAENVGFIVPAPVIRHFLEDVADGRFDGFPELGIWVQSSQSPALRSQLGLKPGQGGVLVTAVSTTDCAYGALEPGDVLLSIDGTAIGADGSVALSDGVRVSGTVLEQAYQVGDEVELTLLRQGALQQRKLRMRVPRPLVPIGDFDRDLPYRVWAGLVFQPLTGRYLAEFETQPTQLLAYYDNPVFGGHRLLVPERGIAERRSVVVLTRVLASELTRGYEEFEDQVVVSVDGTTVRDLRHLSELLDAAGGEFVTIKLDLGMLIVLDRRAAQAAHQAILQQYQIPSDRSRELREALQ